MKIITMLKAKLRELEQRYLRAGKLENEDERMRQKTETLHRMAKFYDIIKGINND